MIRTVFLAAIAIAVIQSDAFAQTARPEPPVPIYLNHAFTVLPTATYEAMRTSPLPE